MNPIIHLLCSTFLSSYLIYQINPQGADIPLYFIAGLLSGTLIDLDHIVMIFLDDKTRAWKMVSQFQFQELYRVLENGYWGSNITKWRRIYVITHSITCLSLSLLAFLVTEKLWYLILPNVFSHYLLDLIRLISRTET